VNDLSTGVLNIDQLFVGEIAHLADGTVLPDYINDIIAGVDDITIAEGRRLALAETDKECNKYGPLCTWLSKAQNAGKRMDWALEIDPTAVMAMLKSSGRFNVSAGWINQMQGRLFFTHPRLNAAGRYYTEIRLRLLDFDGIYGSVGAESTYGALNGDFGADGGLVTVRDIILPYTWAKDETYANRIFQGAKYLAVTGVMAEGTFDGKLSLDKIKDLPDSNNALSYMDNVIQSIEGVDDITGIELIEQTADEVTVFASGLGGAPEFETILPAIEELPSKFGSNLGFEVGLGFTPAAFYFDLREMRSLALAKGYPPALASIPFQMFTIITAEVFGYAGAVGSGMLLGLNEVALVENWGAGLALDNSELMLGGLIGDMIYYGVHRAIFGESDAVSWNAETFWWGAGKLGGSFFGQDYATYANIYYGTSGHTSGVPIKFRGQINGSWWAKEFFSSGKKQLKPYGSFQLKANSGNCFKYRKNQRDITQRTCRSTDDKYYWMAKPFGTPGESTYQLRSQFDGKCVATNDTVSNSSSIKVEACDSSLNQRFKMRIVSGKMTFASVLNETMCFDDKGGTEIVYMWSCGRNNENQHFTVDYSTGIDVEDWTDLKISGAIKHTIRAKDATNCISTGTNNPVNGTLSKLAACETDLNNSNQTYYLVKTDGGHIKILSSNTDPAVVSGDRAYLGQRNASAFKATFLTVDANWTDWLVLVQDDGSVKFQNRQYGTCLQQEDEQIFTRACQSENDAGQRFIINIDKYNRDQGYEL
jgi:hypothetical protein